MQTIEADVVLNRNAVFKERLVTFPRLASARAFF